MRPVAHREPKLVRLVSGPAVDLIGTEVFMQHNCYSNHPRITAKAHLLAGGFQEAVSAPAAKPSSFAKGR